MNLANEIDRILGALVALNPDGAMLDQLVTQAVADMPDRDMVKELILRVMTADGAREMYDLADAELTGPEIREAANRHVLGLRELEWTSHGIQRTFRYWPEEQLRHYVGFAAQVAADLMPLSGYACLGFGSVLAAVRGGELIPHDDDIDVLVGFPQTQASDIPSALALMADHLIGRGYSVSGQHLTHRWVWSQGAGRAVDVFVGIIEDGRVGWYPGERRGLDLDDMFPASIGTIAGVRCPLPRNPLLYLETIYGTSWRTPDSGFRHDWGRSH